MHVTVKFPVRGNVRVQESWPIRVGFQTFFVERDDVGRIAFVGITYSGVALDQAPRLVNHPEGRIRASILSNDDHRFAAEEAIRSWQALLATFTLIDIDFDSPMQAWKPESHDEEGKIEVTEYKIAPGERYSRPHEFSMFGQAFLAAPRGYQVIEEMTFFIEAERALDAARSVDAFNSFYLFLETRFHLSSSTSKAVQQLLGQAEFVAAISTTLAEGIWRSEGSKFRSLESSPTNVPELVREIVEMRGFLRHHSLKNPKRWDPRRQSEYDKEAVFLAMICQEIARATSFDIVFDPQYTTLFAKLAEEIGQMCEVQVHLTIRDNTGLVRDVFLKTKVPQGKPTAGMAKAALEHALRVFDERTPGGELYGVRAHLTPSGPELFRYDLGPALPR